MARRLALDTGVLIALERGLPITGKLITSDDDLAVPLIAMAEYQAGVRYATPEHRPRMQSFLDALLQRVDLLPYDETAMKAHVDLLVWTKQHGVARGPYDLIIAATAAATGRTLVTLDKRAHFDELPGVTAIALLP